MKPEMKRVMFKSFFTGMGVVLYGISIYLLLQFALFIARLFFVF
jgi:hypothetical protein